MPVSRRAALAAGTAAIVSALAACGRAQREAGGSQAATPSVSTDASGDRTGTSRAQTGADSTSASHSRPSPATGAGQAAPAGPALEYAHGPRTRPEVALTFHGDGDPAIARQLLSIFSARNAAVTILAVGRWLHSYPQLAREIVDGGHELGNHTYNHLDVNSLATGAADDEIVRCRDLLVSLIGSGGTHFRPSQAQSATPLVRQLAGAAGYPVCLSYDVDSLDFTDPGPAAIRRNVAAAGPGSIVSMHLGHPGTVTAMPQILTDLAARGLKPVTARTLLRP